MSVIREFNFPIGKVISSKYTIVEKLGSGWEGEVYRVSEIGTGIERSAKFFFPDRNPNNRVVKYYAKKLHKLSSCNSLIKYISTGSIIYKKLPIVFMLSDYVEGMTLQTYIDSYYPRGMPEYQALHLLYSLSLAVEEIHSLKDFHGDLHPSNIIIQKIGLNYQLKLIDVFHVKHGGSIKEDTVSLCHILYDIIGGKSEYRKQTGFVKEICCGLKRGLILKKFKNATQLRTYLELQNWES